MPLNSRYTKGPYSSSSSLYKQALSAQNKINSINDAEAKYQWDTGQISNEQYLSYVQKRAGEVTDEMDKISWGRTLMSVGKEIRADKRAQMMLSLSTISDNSSTKIAKKVQGLVGLYNDAAQWGDQDAMVSLETQINNATNSYYNKLESEAKSGQRKAYSQYTELIDQQEKLLNLQQTYLAKNMIVTNPEQVLLNGADPQVEQVDDPIKAAFLMGSINLDKSTLRQSKAELVRTYSDDPSSAMGYEQQAQSYKLKANDFMSKVSLNQDGTLATQTDAYGRILGQPAEGYAVAFGADGKAKIVDTKTKDEYQVETDANGEKTLVKSEQKNNYYTDPTTGRMYQIESPTITNPEDQYKLNKDNTAQNLYDKRVDAGQALDTRTFTQWDSPTGQPIKWNLNSGKPTTANPIHAEQLQQAMINLRQGEGTYNPLNDRFENSPGAPASPATVGLQRGLGPQNVDLRTPTGFATFMGINPDTDVSYLSRQTSRRSSNNDLIASLAKNTASEAVKKLATPAVSSVAKTITPLSALAPLAKKIANPISKIVNSFSPRQSQAGTLMNRPTGGQLIGSAGGVNYFRVAKSGGWDFYKGKDFKISVNDVAKEVLGDKNKTQNYLNKSWHL